MGQDTVSVRPPFETAEQRNIYKLACAGSLAVGVAEEALTLLDEMKRYLGSAGLLRLEELHKKLDKACDFGF